MEKSIAISLKKAAAIQAKVDNILTKWKVSHLINIELNELVISETHYAGRGRPGKNAKTIKKEKEIYTLAWSRNSLALKQEKRTDGVFPLLSTDDTLSSKEVLQAYKYQPYIEKRFSQLKSVNYVAPLYFKNIERLEANMFLFFVAMVVQGLLEREVRKNMASQNLTSIDIYPEQRESKYPTTASLLNTFEHASSYEIKSDKSLIEAYRDELSSVQKEVINLLGIKENQYFGE